MGSICLRSEISIGIMGSYGLIILGAFAGDARFSQKATAKKLGIVRLAQVY